jgi:hypothetical protein
LKQVMTIVALSLVLTTSPTIGYHLGTVHQINPTNKWEQSIHGDEDAEGFKLFSLVKDAQKFLNDRNISFNILGGRYSFFYKRLY